MVFLVLLVSLQIQLTVATIELTAFSQLNTIEHDVYIMGAAQAGRTLLSDFFKTTRGCHSSRSKTGLVVTPTRTLTPPLDAEVKAETLATIARIKPRMEFQMVAR